MKIEAERDLTLNDETRQKNVRKNSAKSSSRWAVVKGYGKAVDI